MKNLSCALPYNGNVYKRVTNKIKKENNFPRVGD